MFKLKKLPYDYSALEPIISEDALKIHHQKHHQAYTDNFNIAISENKIKTDFSENSILEIFSNISKYTKAIENHGGGYWNHDFFWNSLSPEKEKNIINKESNIFKLIKENFKTFENFEKEFKSKSATLFGSGWTWLVLTEDKKLKIIQTFNQENPLMDFVIKRDGKNIPLLVIDVWEHAYYVDYQNRRPDFINNFFKIINWKKVEKMLDKNI